MFSVPYLKGNPITNTSLHVFTSIYHQAVSHEPLELDS